MQTTDEGVVGLHAVLVQLSVAEVDLAIGLDADDARWREAVRFFPSQTRRPNFRSPKGTVISWPSASMCRSYIGPETKASGVIGKRILLAVPSLQQPKPHLAWIEIQGVGLLIRLVPKRSKGSALGLMLFSGRVWSVGLSGGQAYQGGNRCDRESQNQPAPLPATRTSRPSVPGLLSTRLLAPLPASGGNRPGSWPVQRAHLRLRDGDEGSRQAMTRPSATNHLRST